MDGYTLAALLRRARRRYRLSATSQALYYELVAIANEEGWPDTFKCSNGELCSALSLTEKTVLLARQELIQSELIGYKSGKGRRSLNDYSFINWKISSFSGGIKESISDSNSSPNPPDYNKLKEKPKPKQTVVVANCATAFDFFLSTKNKRLLAEQHKLTDEQLEWYGILRFKVDLGDLNGKTLEDITKNFYYWLPKHLAVNVVRNTSDVIRYQPNVQRKTSNVQPTRGIAAALQFTDKIMRE